MRNYILLTMISFGVLIGCKKSEIPTYEGPEGLTFSIGQYEADSTSYSFSFNLEPIHTDTIFLKLRVLGGTKDYPRTIDLHAIEGSTARLGVDYELPKAVVGAGEVTAVYPLIIHKTPEMDEQILTLNLEIKENEYFKKGVVGQEIGMTYNVDRYGIRLTNVLVEPIYWEDVSSYFGEFSQTKFRFMIEVTGMTDFSYDNIGVSGSYSLPVKLRNALIEYEKEHGTPLIDEYGDVVTF